MIKKISILMLIILVSCTDQLLEKTSPLDGIYYVLDGWEKFEIEDYNRAHDLFSTVLLNNTTQYFADAYIGLAWNSIYKANTIQGVSNLASREYQRQISNEYFILAEEYVILDEVCPNESCSELCQNLLAGQAYNSSYLALESSRKFYDYGLDSTYWESMQDYSQSTLDFSDLLFSCNSEYVFSHDTLINHNAIRVLRAQTYVRLSDFDSAQEELLDIQDLINCNFDIQTVVECLNSLD